MDYGAITPQAVPHISTLTNSFSISYAEYERSLGIEISFMLLVLPLLALAVYFATRESKTGEDEVKKNPKYYGDEDQS